MRNMKKLLISSIAIPGFLLIGCTTTQIASNILAGCTALGAGAQAVATIAGLLPDGAAVSTVVNGLIGSVANDCPVFANDVAGIIAEISNVGGSGTVTVAASTAAMKVGGQKAKVVVFHFGPYGT